VAFVEIIETVGKVIDATGVAVIVGGAVLALALTFSKRVVQGTRYESFRRQLGRSILLGLEFLVAADIIRTVAVDATPQSVLVLGGIVLIRTFLSFSLEVEMTGVWPWRMKAAGTAPAADQPK
jgi:uncharacterized membrane protein